MTREEAISRLKNIAWLYGSSEREQNIQAVDMAIEALQESQTETQGERMTRIVHELSGWDQGDAETATTTDCIGREQAIVAVTNALWHYPNILYKNLNTYEIAWGVASDAINNLPPVTPTERTGEWVKRYADELCLIATYTCSECGSMELSEFKYCPNCGAKMYKEENNE